MTDTTAAPARAGLELPYTHVDDHFIDGAYLASTGAQRNDVVDPATEEVWASVPNATEEDLDRAVGAAERAFAGWAARTPAERAQVLLRAAEEIEARREPMALTNTRENGTPLAETRGAAANAAGIFRYFAPWPPGSRPRTCAPSPTGRGRPWCTRTPSGCAPSSPRGTSRSTSWSPSSPRPCSPGAPW